MADPTELATRLAALSPERRRLLRERLEAGRDSAPVAVPRDGAPLPASFFQERLWLLEQMVPGSSAYVVWFALRITGELDAGTVSEAFEVLVRRHEALRTSLARVDGRLVQVVHDAVGVPLDRHDVRHSADPEAEARRLLADRAGTGFALDRPPLLRVCLVRTADREHLIGLFLHHTITDGWSNGVLLDELGTVYRALRSGAEPDLRPLRLQYADAAAWQRRRLTDTRLAELSAHWESRLRGVPEVFALPLDRPRQVGSAAPGGCHALTVPERAVPGLRALARQERATSFMVVLAALAATLSRWSGQTDVVVGSPQSGRTHRDLDQVVGPLVNTVVLRLAAPGDTTGRELVRRARRVALDAHAHADLPFERLVQHLRPRRSATHHPVFQVNLGVRDFPQGGLSLPGAEVRPAFVDEVGAPKFDLSVYLTTGSDTWTGTIEYNAGLFDATTVRRLADGFAATLAGLAGDPDRTVAELPTGDLPSAAAARTESAPAPPVARQPIEPRDRWERAVAQAWATVLGIERVDATDDFFAIGGHSMAGMLAVERIHQLTGRRPGLAMLFRNPTVEAFAAALRCAEPGAEVPFVVALREHGKRPPLFFAPPAVGELAPYFSLARELGADRPLYGLQPDGFFRDGDPGDLTLEQQAARYAEEIVAAHPAGPYHLCGFSAAGRLAVAVADGLARHGHPVGAVVLLDSAPYGDVAPDPDLATVLARWLSYAPPATELSTVDRLGQVARTLAAGVRAGELPPSLTEAEFREWCRRLEFGARALAGHGPLSYPGALTLLYRGGRTDRDIAAEWDGLPVGELRAHAVPVDDHLSFIEGPSVPTVAGLVAGHLAAADRTGPTPGRRWR